VFFVFNCSIYVAIFSIFYNILLSLMSHIVFICMIIFELIHDDDDDMASKGER